MGTTGRRQLSGSSRREQGGRPPRTTPSHPSTATGPGRRPRLASQGGPGCITALCPVGGQVPSSGHRPPPGCTRRVRLTRGLGAGRCDRDTDRGSNHSSLSWSRNREVPDAGVRRTGSSRLSSGRVDAVLAPGPHVLSVCACPDLLLSWGHWSDSMGAARATSSYLNQLSKGSVSI